VRPYTAVQALHAMLANPGRGVLTISTRPMLCSDEPSPRVCASIIPQGESCGHVRYRFECLLSTTLLPDDKTRTVLLYGNRSVKDILCKELLDGWAAAHPARFKVVYMIGSRWR